MMLYMNIDECSWYMFLTHDHYFNKHCDLNEAKQLQILWETVHHSQWGSYRSYSFY